MTLEITVLYFAKTTEFYQAWWNSPQKESTAYELLSLLKLWENHSTGNKSLGLKDKEGDQGSENRHGHGVRFSQQAGRSGCMKSHMIKNEVENSIGERYIQS